MISVFLFLHSSGTSLTQMQLQKKPCVAIRQLKTRIAGMFEGVVRTRRENDTDPSARQDRSTCNGSRNACAFAASEAGALDFTPSTTPDAARM